MSIFKDYAKYYDLIYQEKNYPSEALYTSQLIKQHLPQAHTILDLGCGTGRYEQEFSKLGYHITGVDFSRDMLDEAYRNKRAKQNTLIHADIRNVRLDKTFDVVISLFHVMSYQVKDEDILSTMQTANEHLLPGGLFLFDFWFEGGVVASPPYYREKLFHEGNIEIFKKSMPLIQEDEKKVTVNISLTINDMLTDKITQLSEKHIMRYFSVSELSEKLQSNCFSVLEALKWQSRSSLEQSINWNGVIVAQKGGLSCV